ncbi:hypothetical protein KR50_14350 [Jeotgalibacillus campisalis]|uniref:Uncharacterized protein n=1 Tax=Jeotgalibacillus campisalis TaxID=220754 RepID=A0A0C2S322_9BACL|nr:hypothetical protein KR50_14350 [Jeotgalibacillus campisalis]
MYSAYKKICDKSVTDFSSGSCITADGLRDIVMFYMVRMIASH